MFGDQVTNADAAWAAAESGLCVVVALSSWLAPTFIEVADLVLWTEGAAKEVDELGLETDATAFERENNAVNLTQFCVHSFKFAYSNPDYFEAFGLALTHFWGITLHRAFPTRKFVLAVVNDIPGEDGLPCFTFWQDRS